jgi:hypothetical protein
MHVYWYSLIALAVAKEHTSTTTLAAAANAAAASAKSLVKAVQSPGQQQQKQLSDMESELRTYQGEFASDMSAKERQASQDVGSVMPALSQAVEESTSGIAELGIEVQAEKDRLTRESDTLIEKQTTFNTEMNEANSEVINLGENALKLMKDRAQEFEDLRDETSQENTDEYQELANEIIGDTREFSGELTGTLQDSVTEMQEQYSEIQEAMQETLDTDKETWQEAKAVAGEIDDSNKETKSELNSFKRENSRTIEKVTKQAGKLPSQLQRSAAKDNQVAARAVKAVFNQLSDELKDMAKDFTGQAGEVQTASREQQDELGDEANDLKMEFNTQKNDIKKDKAQADLELTALQLDAMNALTVGNDDATTLQETAEGEKESAEEELNELVGESEQKLLETSADLESAEATAADELKSQTTEMQEVVESAVHEQQAQVEANVENAISILQNNVNKVLAEAEKGIEKSKSQAGSTEDEINQNAAALANLQSVLTDTMVELRKQQGAVTTLVNETKTETLTAIADVKESVTKKQAERGEELKAEAARVSNETKKLSDQVQAGLIEKVDKLKSEAEKSLDMSAQRIKSTTDRGKDVMTTMEVAAENIAKLNQQIRSLYPSVKKSVGEATTSMDAELEGARGQLQVTKETAIAGVNTEEENMRSEAQLGMESAKDELMQQLESSSQQVGEMITGLRLSQEDLAKALTGDYTDGSNFQDSVRRQIENALKQVAAANEKAESNGVDVKERLRMATQTVNAQIQAQTREGNILEKSVLAAFSNQRSNAISEADSSIKAAKEAASAELKKTEQAALASFAADLKRINGYIADNEGRLGGLNDVVDGLQARLDSSIQNGVATEQSAKHRLETLEHDGQVLSDKAKASAMRQAMIQEQTQKDLRLKQTQMIQEMRDNEDAALNGFVQQQETAMQNEETRQAMEAAKEQSDIDSMNNNLAQQMAGVNKAVTNAGALTEALSNEEANAAKSLSGGLSDLDSSRQIGEDFVNEEGKKAQQQIQRTAGNDLNGLEAVMGASDSSGEKAAAEQQTIASEFQSQLEHFQAASEQQTGALTESVMRLVQNAPDFQQMFNDDTMDSRNEIAAAHERIDTAANWTEGVMATYQKKLEDVRHQREEEASTIHQKVSDVKKMVVDEAGKTVDMVDEVRAKMSQSKKDMADQLAAFKNQLSQLSTVSTDHDQEDLDALESGMFTLEAGHNRLVDKVSHYFHYDRAFNEEVEGQLRAMGKAIDNDDVSSESEELEQEMGMNSQLNSLKDRFSEQVAAVTADGTKAFGNMAQNLADGVQGVLRLEERGAREKAEAEKRAQNSLAQKGLAQAQAMASVRENEANLEKQAGLLHKATAEAQGEVESGFLLPKLSASDDIAAIDDKYNDLAYKMKSMGSAPQSLVQKGGMAPGSLLQTGDTHLRAEGRLLASDLTEEGAVASLNQELYRENEKLAEQNTRLQQRLGRAWQYLAKHNVAEAQEYVKTHNAST